MATPTNDQSSCTDPETGRLLFEYELGRLAGEERERIERHLETCPPCAVSAFEFAEPAHVLREHGWSLRDVLRGRSGSPLLAVAAWAGVAAAAVVLVMMLGPGERLGFGGPPVFRGGGDAPAIELVAPHGELERPPAVLRWNAEPDADRYEVTLYTAELTVLWRTVATTEEVALPAEVVARLAEGGVFVWRVVPAGAPPDAPGASGQFAVR